MNFRNFGAIILLLAIALFSAGVFNSGCYLSDDETRVTIRLQRNDLGMNNYIPEKRMIDRVLEFLSTPGYAFFGWNNVVGDLTLKVRSSSFNEMIYEIPSDATSYTVVVPAVSNVTFEITSLITEGETGDVPQNWGGHTTVSLSPGEQDIAINMVPMTLISFISDGGSGIFLEWYSVTYADSYKIYRSSQPEGQLTYIDSITGTSTTITDTSGMVPGGTYYYRISVVYNGREGVMCAPAENLWEGIY